MANTPGVVQQWFGNQPPKLIMFDLDGTLVDSVPDLAAAVDDMLTALQRPVAGIANVSHWIGNGATRLVQRALTNGDETAISALSEALLRDALALFHQHYARHNGQHTQLYPGVQSTLSALQAQQIPMAIVTNKPEHHTRALLDLLHERDGLIRFNWIIGGDTLPEQKPHPAPLLDCLKHAGCRADEAMMVGDSINDVRAAQQAGVRVAAVRYGYNHGIPVEETGADAVIDSMQNLLYC